MTETNVYCEVLGIDVPQLENVVDHRDANTFSLLIVALLEAGKPLDLATVAQRIAKAKHADPAQVLKSLQRCRPARPPVVRSGDLYVLDPHHDEADFWTYVLGLREARVPRLRLVPTADELELPRPPDERLTIQELEIAWKEAWLTNSSHVSLAAAVLDAHDQPLSPDEISGFLDGCDAHHRFSVNETYVKSKAFKLQVDAQQRWSLPEGYPHLASVRAAVRKRVRTQLDQQDRYPSKAEREARAKIAEKKKERRVEELSRLRRAIVHAWPLDAPKVTVVIDVATREIQTFRPDNMNESLSHLEPFDLFAGSEIHRVLTGLGFDPETRRISDLGPPQKSARFSEHGKVHPITLDLVIRGSCLLKKATSPHAKLDELAHKNQLPELERRLVSDAKALHALYEFGRLHGHVRVTYRNHEIWIPAPWSDREDRRAFRIFEEANEREICVEAVIGTAIDWDDPWKDSVLTIPIFDGLDWYLVPEFDEARLAIEAQAIRLVNTDS